MTDNTGRGNGVSGSEVAVILGVVVLGAGAIGSVAVGQWHRAVLWMLTHQVLIPAAAEPTVALPASSGAGVDWPRVFIAAAGVMVAVAIGVHELRERFAVRGSA